MPHNGNFWAPSILSPTWVPEPSQIRTLDKQIAQSVNGDAGGTWIPSLPITIGGSGLSVSGAGGFSGGVSTGHHAQVGALQLGDSDWPVFTFARTRKILFTLNDPIFHQASDASAAAAIVDFSVPGQARVLSTSGTVTCTRVLELNRFPVGGTVTEVRLRFKVGIKPASVPGSLPQVGWRVGSSAEYKTMNTPATVAAYYNNGLPQDIFFTPPTLGSIPGATPIAIAFVDASQTLNTFLSIGVTISIPNMRPGL